MRLGLLFLSLFVIADNEIYIDQSGANAVIKLEQLGSDNLIGGTSAISGTMTALDLDGTDMTLTINQIGGSNIFRSDAFDSDYVTGLFNFDGDSNVFDILMNSSGLYSADYSDFDIDVVGSSNVFDIEVAENDDASYLDLDWIITGDSNEFNFDIDYENAVSYLDINGSSNEITFDGSGYSGTTASDSGYFYLDLTGSSNTYNITQSSTLARDWLKIISNASNSTVCIVQSDGGTSTSC
jgi:hypothetical protein|tara:strand:- start:512 stop:1228 length:717 start_codon:yes stop_codon:yes gene_type:complete